MQNIKKRVKNVKRQEHQKIKIIKNMKTSKRRGQNQEEIQKSSKQLETSMTSKCITNFKKLLINQKYQKNQKVRSLKKSKG